MYFHEVLHLLRDFRVVWHDAEPYSGVVIDLVHMSLSQPPFHLPLAVIGLGIVLLQRLVQGNGQRVGLEGLEAPQQRHVPHRSLEDPNAGEQDVENDRYRERSALI